MVRTYATVNATTSRVGELFDLVVKESEQGQRNSANNGLTVKDGSSVAGLPSRPVSDISLGPAYKTGSNRPNSVPLEPRTGWPTDSAPQKQPVSLPKEEAIFVEPVFGGNLWRKNPSYYDYERQMREQDRQQRQAYMRDLQRQLEEQREHRIRNEIALGGHEFEKELLKNRRQRPASYSSTMNRSDESYPIGHSITSSAGRNRTQNGAAGFGYNLGNSAYGTDYDKYLRAAELQQKREYSMALQSQQQNQEFNDYRPPRNNGIGTGGYTPTFASRNQYRSVPSDLNLFQDPTYDPLSLNYAPQRQGRLRKQASYDPPDEIYDPWGKGGAGAPIRDRNGRMVTDRRHLQKSWNGMVDTNVPHDSSQNRSTLASALRQFNSETELESFGEGKDIDTYPGMAIMKSMAYDSSYAPRQQPVPMNEKDYYKEELRKQMEEQKRLKQLEKEKERLEDERDRMRVEREAERQRREIEEEKRKQQEKAQRGQRRADVAQHRTDGNKGDGKRKQPDDGLEWWERQPQTSLITRSNSADAVTRKPNARAPPTPTDHFESPTDHHSHRPTQAAHHRSPQVSHRPTHIDSHRPTHDNHRPPQIDHHRPTHVDHNPTPIDHHRATPVDNHKPQLDRRVSSPNLIGKHEDPRNRSAVARNEQIMRQLSAMRERLNKEQMRVKSAIRRRDYSDDLFDDEHERSGSANAARPRPANHVSHPVRNTDRLQHGRQLSAFPDDGDDPPLVKLIKNSRTFGSAELRRPPPMAASYRRGDLSPDSDNHDAVIDQFLNQGKKGGRHQNGY